MTDLILEKIITAYGVPAGFAVFVLYQIWKTPIREDPSTKILDKLEDIKNPPIEHGNRLTRVETVLEERK